MSEKSRLAAYASRGHAKVEGWLSVLAIKLILNLAETQKSASLRGPVCEIGVHHGRLFILLALATRQGERAVAYDLFANQHVNTSLSGKGDLEKLAGNLKRHGCDKTAIRMVTTDSMDLTRACIVADCGGRPRLFSVDGGHTAALTINDLRLAAGTICPGGLVILDDFFNERWPGVADGASRFMFSHNRNLIPAVIGGNKLFFTTSFVWAERYKQSLRCLEGTYLLKDAQLFGHDVVVVSEALTKSQKDFLRAFNRRRCG